MIKYRHNASRSVPEIQVMPGHKTGDKKWLAKDNINLKMDKTSDSGHLRFTNLNDWLYHLSYITFTVEKQIPTFSPISVLFN